MGNPLNRIFSRRKVMQETNRERFAQQELARIKTQRGFGKRVASIDSAIKQLGEGKIGLEEAEKIKAEIGHIQKVVPSEVRQLLEQKLQVAITKAAHK